jgi:hypothetical protein
VPADTLPLNGIWVDGGHFVPADSDAYAPAAATYRTGQGLF